MGGFIERISNLYNNDNRYHNWRHASQVTLCASYLAERMQDEDPWYPFVAAFIALVHDVKHLGVPNGVLEAEDHPLSHVFDDSLQERQSIHAALSILIEEFPT